MKVAFITRSTLFTVRGGDTTQVLETAKWLQSLGVTIDIKASHEKIDYGEYDLLHFFNIIRPADILHHLYKTDLPFIVSPVMVDYSEYDKGYRKGLPGFIFRPFSSDAIEYIKTIARHFIGGDRIATRAYWWKGQRKCIKEILNRTPLLLPNSDAEYEYMRQRYTSLPPYVKVPDGVDPQNFFNASETKEEPNAVVCAARIEGLKNQLTLIRALNNTNYRLYIIGSAAPNQPGYYRRCRKIAGDNIIFTGHVSQQLLLQYYQKAKVHILPSWWEVCGLSSLEAAATGCNIVVTDKGFPREYFGDLAFYCDPSSASSVLNAVERAMNSPRNPALQKRIMENFTWQQAAAKTLKAYQRVLNNE